MWGGQLVGMTSVPEVVLARELGMCYASIAMVTNFAAGISPEPLTHQEVVQTMAENTHNLQEIIIRVMKNLDLKQSCLCPDAAKEVGFLAERRNKILEPIKYEKGKLFLLDQTQLPLK